MTDTIDIIVADVSEWDGVKTGEHRYGGTEFSLGPREIGHVHRWGILDIAFPRRVRNELVAEGKTGPHHIYPESGWTTFRVEGPGDVDEALWLLRLSYLSHVAAMSDVADTEIPSSLDVDAEFDALEPSGELRALL
ncbi:luciferase family protein [Haladaptatus sp. DYF46]|uniref:luciferase domain-containing protein n=1 Tax=Haladaptatus sp. DYF46 TaxID=2886041 RepID=UPI001E371AB0|nr:luciferase family protein [Haladaptatus sp. DYF46]